MIQYSLNGVLPKVIGRGLIVYTDDILIQHATKEGLHRPTRRVLELLHGARLSPNDPMRIKDSPYCHDSYLSG